VNDEPVDYAESKSVRKLTGLMVFFVTDKQTLNQSGFTFATLILIVRLVPKRPEINGWHFSFR
jgi:hypothetical protein